MINLNSIVPNLQVPECQKPKHFHEKLNAICLDQNCSDFLKLMCGNCQEEHQHKVYMLRKIIDQIVEVISQSNQTSNSNSGFSIEQFDIVLKFVNQLISLCQQLYKYISDKKAQLIDQSNTTIQVAQLLTDMSNQDASIIHEKMKKVFSFFDLKTESSVVLSLKQSQEIQEETSEYLEFVQRLVLQAQNIIQDALKSNFNSQFNQPDSEQKLKKLQDENQQQEQLIKQQQQDLTYKQLKIEQQTKEIDLLAKQIKDLKLQGPKSQQQIQQQNSQQVQIQQQKVQENQPYQFVWNAECEKKMKKDLESIKQTDWGNKSRQKWKQIYSNLMQKSEGKQGFCGKEAEGIYKADFNKWDTIWIGRLGPCGKSDGNEINFFCCKDCWEKGTGNNKYKY